MEAVSYLLDSSDPAEEVLTRLDPARLARTLSRCRNPDDVTEVVDRLSEYLEYGWGADDLDPELPIETLCARLALLLQSEDLEEGCYLFEFLCPGATTEEATKLLEAIDDEELRERCENLLDPGCP